MLWLWLAFSLATIGCIIGVVRGKMKAGLAAGIILFIGFVDVLRVDAQFIKIVSPRPYFASEPALEKLQGEMATAPFRCFSLPGALPQNGEGIHGLEGVGGFHDNELRWYREFRGDQQDRNYFEKLIAFSPSGEAFLKADAIEQGNAFLDIANVKYVLARSGADLIPIENRNALGRVSFAANVVVMDSAEILRALKEGGYDVRTTVALTGPPSLMPTQPIPDSVARRPAAALGALAALYAERPDCRCDVAGGRVSEDLRGVLSGMEGDGRRPERADLPERLCLDGGLPAQRRTRCRDDRAFDLSTKSGKDHPRNGHPRMWRTPLSLSSWQKRGSHQRPEPFFATAIIFSAKSAPAFCIFSLREMDRGSIIDIIYRQMRTSAFGTLPNPEKKHP